MVKPIMRPSGGFDHRRQMKARPIFLFLALAGVGFAATPPAPAAAPEQKAGLADLPLSFEANQGQTDPAVKFLSRGDGYALFLTPDSAVFKLRSAPRELGSGGGPDEAGRSQP